jgi:hypothetical protein
MPQRWILSSALSVLLAGLLLAQGPPPPGDGGPRGKGKMPPPEAGLLPGGLFDGGPNAERRFATVLGLNAGQQNTVHTALEERKILLQGQTAKGPDLRDQLAAAVRSGDEARIDQLTQDLSRLQQLQTSVQAKTFAKIYGALTADQKARFDPSLDRQLGVRRRPVNAPQAGAVQ